MWMLILIPAAMALTLFFPRFSKVLAWCITLGINVPICLLGAGSIAYAIALIAGMTTGSWESYIMYCLIFGSPFALFITWITHKD
jgi:hypothetical protein